MSRSARVYSIESVDELRSALKRFVGEMQDILQSIEHELNRTEHYLQDRLSYWRYEAERYQDEVLNAKRALEHCRDEDSDDHDCSSEEEWLSQTKRHLRQTQEEIQDIKKKLGTLEEVAQKYRGQARTLKRLMDYDLQKGGVFLNSAIINLYEYMGVNEPLGETSDCNRIGGVKYETAAKQLSFVDKIQIMENLPQPEGLPYSDKMKKYLVGLCHLENDDFQTMSKYLKSKEHRPAIFNDQSMAENVLKRDFPSHAEKEGGWNSEWLGITLYFTNSNSFVHGIPEQAHRTIIAKYDEDVLIHELAHQLHFLAWSETGTAGENKRMRVKELYANVISGRVRPVNMYVNDEGEYFAYSVEWFFQRPLDLKSRDPDMFQFLNTQILKGMYHECQ